MLRRDFELLPARLARHLVVEPQEIIAEFCKFGAVLVVGAGGQAIFLHTANPPDAVLVGAPASRALIASRTGFRFFREECAFVECHIFDCNNEWSEARNALAFCALCEPPVGSLRRLSRPNQ